MIPCADDDLVDGGHARAAIAWLEQRDTGKPFFLAVGFHRPHLPLVAPARYFTGVPPLGTLQGRSLRLLLDDPRASLHDAAFTQARRGKDAEVWGRSVRTARWRCTEWNEGRDGLELYDHDADPREYTNLASEPRHAKTLSELRALLALRLPPTR